ncbi:MAG: hypothetical protein ACE5F2_00485 [Candidatus Paceibacteria bacterium]
MSIDEAREKLIEKTVSFIRGNSGPFILKDISKIKEIWELESAAIAANSEDLAYGVEGILVQPYTEIPEDPKKPMTIFVYSDTDIDILDNEECLFKRIEKTKNVFNLIQQEGYY